MKYFFVIIFLSASVLTNAQPVRSGMHKKEVKAFQKSLNHEFADPKESPLTVEDQARFKKLDFFPIDSKYRVVAGFSLTPDAHPFEMPTSTDRKPMYRQYGAVTFVLDGKSCTLRIYQNIDLTKKEGYSDYLFLPFNDYTNGNESYGGGRYLDLTIPNANTILIDFNKAYNPYCAYNHKYSCPIPPAENKLDLEIRAGVKAYKAHDH